MIRITASFIACLLATMLLDIQFLTDIGEGHIEHEKPFLRALTTTVVIFVAAKLFGRTDPDSSEYSDKG